jgi:hypothetical protein
MHITTTAPAGRYPVTMDAKGAIAVRTQYWQRPGKRAVVVTDLAYLHGAASGTVVLPHWLYWSPAGRAWNLDDPHILRSFYQTVLNQVVEAGDLTDYLDRDTLIEIWPDLWLPKGLRAAWEEYHPQLRSAAAA